MTAGKDRLFIGGARPVEHSGKGVCESRATKL